MRYQGTAVMLGALAAAPLLSAWNEKGHMTVAYIALQKLKPEVKSKVRALLKENPMHGNWVQGMQGDPDDDEHLLRAFLRASVWADVIKSNCSDDDTAAGSGGNRPKDGDPRTSQNIGYVDPLCHKYWHFHDKGFSGDGTAMEDPPLPSALTMVPILVNGLKSSADPKVRSYDLVWLMHIVGDLHQPLHATARFTVNQQHGDAGGNFVKLSVGRGSAAPNLHSFWDGALGNETGVEAAVALGQSLLHEFTAPASAADLDAAHWIEESFKLAKKFVYASPIQPDGSESRTNSAYRRKAAVTAEKQAILGGNRLARLINEALQ